MRVANVVVLVVCACALLTAFRVPLNRLLGWLLIPLGGAPLYVFIVHVAVALVIDNIPALDDVTLWMNPLAHTAIVLLWVMVKRQVRYRWIPR